MNTVKMFTLVCLFMAALTTFTLAKPASSTFFGEIADSQCALNVHSLTRSHQEMLKSKSMGGTSLSCSSYCIRYLGGDLVLTSKSRVYRLDHQDLAQKFVAENVKITGTLDRKSSTIHIEKIELQMPNVVKRPTP